MYAACGPNKTLSKSSHQSRTGWRKNPLSTESSLTSSSPEDQPRRSVVRQKSGSSIAIRRKELNRSNSFEDDVRMNSFKINKTISSNDNNDQKNCPTDQQQQQVVEEEFCSSNDFFADSPYYNAFVEKEISSLAAFVDIMKDIVRKSEEFRSSGKLMVTVTKRFANSCNLRWNDGEFCSEKEIEEKKNALGPTMASHLQCLGKSLEEIAAAQEIMVESIENAFSKSLAENAMVELDIANKLRHRANAQTQNAENLFLKYLCERNQDDSFYEAANSSSGNKNNLKYQQQQQPNETDSNNNIKAEIIQGKTNVAAGEEDDKTTRLGDLKLSRSNSGLCTTPDQNPKKQMIFRNLFSRVEPIKLPNWKINNDDTDEKPNNNNNSHSSIVEEGDESSHLVFKATERAKLKYRLQTLRTNQARAELRRFQVTKHFLDSKCHRNLGIGKGSLKFVNALKIYYENCYFAFCKFAKKASKNNAHFIELHNEHLKNDTGGWQVREKLVFNKLDEMKGAETAAYEEFAYVIECGGKNIDTLNKNCDHDAMEKELQIWDFQNQLAKTLYYRRVKSPGVICEGWVHQQYTSALLKKESWNREWLVLKNGALHSLKQVLTTPPPSSSGGMTGRTISDHAIESVKEKICDVVLCTVKEISEDSNKGKYSDSCDRFCFELIMYNQKRPIVFKTRGPDELYRWTKSIRNAISSELTKGSAYSSELNKGIGGKYQKKSSEIDFSVHSGGANCMLDSGHKKNYVYVLRDSKKVPDLPTGSSFHSMSSARLTTSIETINSDVENSLVTQVMEANSACADCSKSSPDWVSLNLGCLLCINCSGVHRSLGVHVSKVRSLNLDSLTDREAQLILSLGNDRMNKILEKEIIESIEEEKAETADGNNPTKSRRKPGEFSDNTIREKFIKDKYIKKEFIGDCQEILGTFSTIDEKLFKANNYLRQAARKRDLIGIATALAHGANLNWKDSNMDDDDDENTCGNALGVCVMLYQQQQQRNSNKQQGDTAALSPLAEPKKLPNTIGNEDTIIDCIELLLQNRADMDKLNSACRATLDNLISKSKIKSKARRTKTLD